MAVRRSSYGPTSPVVGERGARTRQHIVDVTLGLLSRWGYHAVLVDDIAREAGISRATLYQYFSSKEEIFVELLEECGSALQRVVRRLGPLGPTADGYDNLHWWLGEWAWVYDKYVALFIEWAGVDSPNAPLRPHIARFEELYIGRLAERLDEAGLEGLDASAAAVSLLAVVERYNYHRRTTETGLADDDLLDALAAVFQLVLFPRTPPTVLAHPQSAAHRVRATPRRRAPSGTRAPASTVADDRFANLGDRARATVAALLDAGGRVFAANGFNGSNVDQIVTEAGLARGTFYKYFTDKLDLLTVLADECAQLVNEAAAQFVGGGSTELRSWLTGFVALHRRYAGVFRAWLEPEPRRRLAASGAGAIRVVADAFAKVLRSVEGPYPLDERAATLMLIALLERVPDEASGTRYQLSDGAAVEAMASFIERGLLNVPARPRRTAPVLKPA